MGKGPEQTSLQGDMQTANRQKEMLNVTTREGNENQDYHEMPPPPTRTAPVQARHHKSLCWRACVLLLGVQSHTAAVGKLNVELPHDPAVPLWTYPEELETGLQWVHSIITRAKRWKQPERPWVGGGSRECGPSTGGCCSASQRKGVLQRAAGWMNWGQQAPEDEHRATPLP